MNFELKPDDRVKLLADQDLYDDIDHTRTKFLKDSEGVVTGYPKLCLLDKFVKVRFDNYPNDVGVYVGILRKL